jgi:hypothetical protein
LYLLGILAAIVSAFAYHTVRNGIFACPARGYDESRYLGYCHGTAYGDYDHGAVWFDLEPGVRAASAKADVLFLGNSRMQFGFSAPALGRWFAANGFSYYLLGFSHNETFKFAAALLANIRPQARAYVIDVDKFFFDWASPPANEVMNGTEARSRYALKRAWQAPHRAICGWWPALCGESIAFYRQRRTGEWRWDGGSKDFVPAAIESDEVVLTKGNPEQLLSMITANARRFIAGLDVEPSCVILTYVPSTENNRFVANAVASALGQKLIAPQGAGLRTFDGSHLERDSAEQFATAFFAEAGPRLRRCLDRQLAPAPGNSDPDARPEKDNP